MTRRIADAQPAPDIAVRRLCFTPVSKIEGPSVHKLVSTLIIGISRGLSPRLRRSTSA